MEKENFILKMEIYYLKVIIRMEKEMVMEKNMIRMGKLNLMENIKMEKDGMEQELNMMMRAILNFMELILKEKKLKIIKILGKHLKF